MFFRRIVRSWELPSGKLTGRNGKPPCLIGDTSSNWWISYCSVSLPEGNIFSQEILDGTFESMNFSFLAGIMLSKVLCNESFLVMGTNKSTLYQRRLVVLYSSIHKRRISRSIDDN